MAHQLPVPLEVKAWAEPRTAAYRREGYALFATQLMGQDSSHRGLKAGAQAIEAAQHSYRAREFSGDADRRLPNGVFARARA
jgi:hypothetical protein